MDITLERILSLIPKKGDGKFKHGALAEFARSIGFKDGHIVSDWINGNASSYFNYLFEISAKYGVSVEWLKGETDDPVSNKVASAVSATNSISSRIAALDAHGRDAILALLACEEARMAREAERSETEPQKVVKLIRHYFSSPAAGVGGMEAGEDYEDIPLQDDAPQNADYCLTVSGDSMEPYIEDGSMVYVQKDVRLDNFDVGVFIVDGVAYIKQYCRGYAGEQYLLSSNPKRRDANITIYPSGNQSFDYKGKVILKKKLPQPIYD